MKDELLLRQFPLRRSSLLQKNRKIGEKGKKKMSSNTWTDARAAMARANELLTLEEIREISNVPSHEIVSQHVHKLVQVVSSLCCCCFFCIYLL